MKKHLTILVAISIFMVSAFLRSQTGTPAGSPEGTVQELWKLISLGKLASASSWNTASALYLKPPARPSPILYVIADNYSVWDGRSSGSEADVEVGYNPVGSIDKNLRFTRDKSKYYKHAKAYHLVKQSDKWLIQQGPSERLITVAAALDYVDRARASAKESLVKANGDRTIEELKRWQRASR